MEAKKSNIIRRLAAVAQIFFLVLTWRSYIGEREYFLAVNILEGIAIPSILHSIIFVLLASSLVFILIKPARAEGSLLFLLFYIIAIFLDVNRFSQYQLHILAFMFIPASLSDKAVNTYLRYIFSLTYLCWGVSLINEEYSKHVIPYLLPGDPGVVHTLAAFIPWVLILSGIMHLVVPNKLIFLFALFLHLAFALFFAFGDSIYIMTPWNLMFVAVCIIGLKGDMNSESSWKLYLIPALLTAWLAMTVVEVLPAGLGFNYYNGKFVSMTLYINEVERSKFPENIQAHLREGNDEANLTLNLDEVYTNTFHSTLLPFKQNYLILGKQFCNNLTDPNNAILIFVTGYGQVHGRDYLIMTYNDLK